MSYILLAVDGKLRSKLLNQWLATFFQHIDQISCHWAYGWPHLSTELISEGNKNMCQGLIYTYLLFTINK